MSMKWSDEAVTDALKRPFYSSEVGYRIDRNTLMEDGDRQFARVVAYVDARSVQRRLDEVLGLSGWSSDLEPVFQKEVLLAYVCRISVHLPSGATVTKSDVGTLDGFSDAPKAGASDAFKRAAVQLGIGRYLYDLEAPWTEVDAIGRMLHVPFLPEWALPNEDPLHWASPEDQSQDTGYRPEDESQVVE